MNLFKYQNLQLHYNNILKRISVNKDDEFMSLTLSTFKLFLTLAKDDSDVNRIQVTQNGSDIEILKLYGNFMLTMQSWKYHSTITISKPIIDKLIENEDSIELRINEEKKKFIVETTPNISSNLAGEELNNSKAETVASYRQSIENVVRSANNSSSERIIIKSSSELNENLNLVKNNNNKGKCIGWCAYGEPGYVCTGDNCTIQSVMEEVSGNTPPTHQLNISSANYKQSTENAVKSTSNNLGKQKG